MDSSRFVYVTYIRTTPEKLWQALMDPDLLSTCNENVFDLDAYTDAEQERRLFGVEFNLLLNKYDILLCPTVHTLPERVEAKSPEPYLTLLFNFSRHPALSIPCGLSVSGLPIGVQLVAAHYREPLLLGAAAAYEAEHGFPKLPIGLPPASSSSVVPHA